MKRPEFIAKRLECGDGVSGVAAFGWPVIVGLKKSSGLRAQPKAVTSPTRHRSPRRWRACVWASNWRKLLECGDGVCGVAAFGGPVIVGLKDASCLRAQPKAVTSPTHHRSVHLRFSNSTENKIMKKREFVAQRLECVELAPAFSLASGKCKSCSRTVWKAPASWTYSKRFAANSRLSASTFICVDRRFNFPVRKR